MMKKVFHLSILIIAVSAVMNLQPLSAEGYQVEVNGTYFNQKADYVENINVFMLDATAYLQEINTDGKPLAEAAFLQKASYLTVTGALKTQKESDGDYDAKIAGGEAAFVFPVPVFVKGSYLYTAVDGDWEYDSAEHCVNGELGYYLTDSLAVAGHYTWDKDTIEFIGQPEFDIKVTTYGCYFKYVSMVNSTMALSIEGTYDRISSKTDGEDKLVNNDYVITAGFYFTPEIGIAGTLGINKGDDKEKAGNTYDIEGIVFITPGIALSAGYGVFKSEKNDPTNSIEDNKHFYASVKGRI